MLKIRKNLIGKDITSFHTEAWVVSSYYGMTFVFNGSKKSKVDSGLTFFRFYIGLYGVGWYLSHIKVLPEGTLEFGLISFEMSEIDPSSTFSVLYGVTLRLELCQNIIGWLLF